uniref:Uncharacterized protein n=1 Tax=Branchiostoma floridae TaxID=7739 RepID=C3ZR42_BRAFL|eukprot:XP_002588904.1 hypothetical protein BRAFLDRAFT_89092 [Branchiostoma floridae]
MDLGSLGKGAKSAISDCPSMGKGVKSAIPDCPSMGKGVKSAISDGPGQLSMGKGVKSAIPDCPSMGKGVKSAISDCPSMGKEVKSAISDCPSMGKGVKSAIPDCPSMASINRTPLSCHLPINAVSQPPSKSNPDREWSKISALQLKDGLSPPINEGFRENHGPAIIDMRVEQTDECKFPNDGEKGNLHLAKWAQ